MLSRAPRSPCSSKSAVAGQAYVADFLYKAADLPVTVHGILANQGSGLGLIELQWINALKLNVPELTAQGRLGIPLRNIVTALARHFSFDGRLTRGFIATCLREVNMYMRHPEAPARLAAREEVASVIAAHQPRIVIAHSLGSVVTYEALHAHPELRVELLVTVGSPLALPHGIFQRLQPAPGNSSTSCRSPRSRNRKRP
ncbi:hypothetical protein [Streptomyces sp. NPDC059215]|uniref:hypothetical protein n=1 Tax=Streptomyces sp. NPDC059215 TaxID=3346772 RepID=UPI003694D332